VGAELGEGEVAVVRTFEERTDGRGLEENVRLVLRRDLGAPKRLHVERPGQPPVDHAVSLSALGYQDGRRSRFDTRLHFPASSPGRRAPL
jgi:hypothetical protein